jgi:anti-sigma regulatory factor (Ser/Thr protein kinase)
MATAGVAEKPEVLLVVSELVTNALTHARSEVELALELDQERLRVEVADGSTDLPQLRHPDPLDVTGRGVFLVDHFADAWGTAMRPNGKVVWCQIGISPTESMNSGK